MKTNWSSTRRSFFWRAGAALSAPLAVAAGAANAADGEESVSLRERLAAHEDVEAIRALNRSLVAAVNARDFDAVAALYADPSAAASVAGFAGLASDSFAAAEAVELAADRRTAVATLECAVTTETAIGPDCTLVQMARQQGEGVHRVTERRVLEQTCVKRDGRWLLLRTDPRSA